MLSLRGHVAPREEGQAGHDAVGQALLVTVVSVGALSTAALARVVVSGMNTLMSALG
jgi:hypothetical protein